MYVGGRQLCVRFMLTDPQFQPDFSRDQWSLGGVLARQADVLGERPFLKWADRSDELSFADANRSANRLARGFQKAGIAKGDAVVIFMPNCLDYILSWFALSKIGAIEAPINVALKGRLLEHQVNSCNAKAVIVHTSLLQVVLNSVEQMPALDWSD